MAKKRLTDEQKAKMRAGRSSSLTGIESSNAEINSKELQTLKRVHGYLPSAKNTFLRAFSGTSKAAAIKAKCIECSCYQKNEVAKCRVTDCALYRYRPYKAGAEDSMED